MTKRELENLVRQLTMKCWACGAEMRFKRRRGTRTCSTKCRKRLERLRQRCERERLETQFRASKITLNRHT